MIVIKLPIGGIRVETDRQGGGSIESHLKESCPHCEMFDCFLDCEGSQEFHFHDVDDDRFETEQEMRDRIAFNQACDGIESLILAHACAGIDIESPAYLEGIETAIQSMGENV